MEFPPRGRLYWLCRRGTKELDRVLGGFLEQDFDRLTPEQQACFVELLYCQDPDIYDWLLGVESPQEPGLNEIVMLLRHKHKLQ